MNHLTSPILLAALALFSVMPMASAQNSPTTGTAAEKHSKLNIILILADDLGYETIGANGGTSYRTPQIDKLARQGLRFEHCYAQPLCTPSRVQIMTGRYNSRNYVNFGYLDVKETTFAQLLKQAGYTTCIAGKWQLNGNDKKPAVPAATRPRHFGFDEWCLWQMDKPGRAPGVGDTRYSNPEFNINGKDSGLMEGKYGPDVCSDFALDFIQRNKDRPFLLYYPMLLPHAPIWPTPASAEWKDPAKRRPGDSKKGQAKYYGDTIAYLDGLVGRVADKVDELGLGDRTLILFTGDNCTDKPIVSMCGGRKVKGAKGAMTDGGTRVPLIARWTGRTPAGKVSNDLVDFSDFLPTMLESAGVPVPADLPIDGRSFAPQLAGQPGNPREWIYCWYFRDGQPKDKDGGEWARTQRYKLYKDGRFYDIANDVLEQKPLKSDALTPEVLKIHDMLKGAIEKNTRPGFYQ